jgi:crotonobetainyl-CoA:carnitine CoA-transferase CaiB-like acyl-CoA transferase
VEQASGLPFVNGEADDPPTMQHAAYGDPVAGLFGAVACLIGLYDRSRRKRGALMDLGQVECLFQLGADAIIAQSLQRERLAREGSRHPLAALRCVCPTNAVRKWIAVTVETPAQWNAVANRIGRSDLVVADGTLDALKRQEQALELRCMNGARNGRARKRSRPCRPRASALDRSTPPSISWTTRNIASPDSGATRTAPSSASI